MQYQIVFGKYESWAWRHDSESIEKYDNDMTDGVHVSGKSAPSAEKVQEIVTAIGTYYNLRFVEKVSRDEWLAANNRINWLVAQAQKSRK